jgi:hypothetical protein
MQTQEPSHIALSDKPFFTGVLSTELDATLPFVENWIKDGVNSMRGRMGYEDMIELLRKGQCQLWVAGKGDKIQACLITEIVIYYRRKICCLRICVGHNRYLWQSYMKNLEDWAISQGCNGMEAIARKGWSRILKDWKTTHYFIEKDLTNGQFTKATDAEHGNRAVEGPATLP